VKFRKYGNHLPVGPMIANISPGKTRPLTPFLKINSVQKEVRKRDSKIKNIHLSKFHF
jgi:hypothetical protein